MTQDDCILAERLLILLVVFLLGSTVLVHCLEQSYPPRSEAAMEAQ